MKNGIKRSPKREIGMNRLDNLLLCVGAQKAGTSWLYSVLRHEPEIEFSRFKEVHYFDFAGGVNHQMTRRTISLMAKEIDADADVLLKAVFEDFKTASNALRSVCDDSWYCNQFQGDKKYAADFTPEYALLKASDYERVKSLSKNQKIIFIMRDPVKRAISALQYFFQNRGRSISSIDESLLLTRSKSPLILPLSQYENTIKTVDAAFSPNQVLYLFYEDVMKNKAESRSQVLKFLDLPISDIEENILHQKVNASTKEVFPRAVIDSLNELLKPTVEKVGERFGRVPESWLASL
jgi:hypothetical protein